MATYVIDFSNNTNNVVEDLLTLTAESTIKDSLCANLSDTRLISLKPLSYYDKLNLNLTSTTIEELSTSLQDCVVYSKNNANVWQESIVSNKLSQYIYNNSVEGRLNVYQHTLNVDLGGNLPFDGYTDKNKTYIMSAIHSKIAGFNVRALNEVQTLKAKCLQIHTASVNQGEVASQGKLISASSTAFNQLEEFVEGCLKPLFGLDLYQNHSLAAKIQTHGEILPNLLNEIDLGIQTFLYASAGKIVKLSDIKTELAMFAQQLDNLYMLDVKLVPISSVVSSNVACCITEALTAYHVSEGGQEGKDSITTLLITPNVVSPKTVIEGTSIFNSVESENDIIYSIIKDVDLGTIKYRTDFSRIIKLNTNQQQIDELFNNVFSNKINGQYLFNVKTIKKDNFDVSQVLKMFDDFGMKKGEVISKNNILCLLDEIFMLWLKSINIMNVIISYCHCNCHSNVLTVAKTQHVLQGCLACGSLVIRDYSDVESWYDGIQDANEIIVHLSIDSGLVIKSEYLTPATIKTYESDSSTYTFNTSFSDSRLFQFTYEIGNNGVYPKLQQLSSGDRWHKSTLHQVERYIDDTNHYRFHTDIRAGEKLFSLYRIESLGDGEGKENYYGQWSGDNYHINRADFQAGNLDKNTILEDDYCLEKVSIDASNWRPAGYFLALNYEPKSFKWTFVDKLKTNRKKTIYFPYNAKIPSVDDMNSTLLAADYGTRQSFFDDNNYAAYHSGITDYTSALLEFVTFVEDGLLLEDSNFEGKRYGGIYDHDRADTYDDNPNTRPLTGQYSLIADTNRVISVDYSCTPYTVYVVPVLKVSGFDVTEYVLTSATPINGYADGAQTTQFNAYTIMLSVESLIHPLKYRDVKSLIKDEINDTIINYSDGDTATAHTMSFSKIVKNASYVATNTDGLITYTINDSSRATYKTNDIVKAAGDTTANLVFFAKVKLTEIPGVIIYKKDGSGNWESAPYLTHISDNNKSFKLNSIGLVTTYCYYANYNTTTSTEYQDNPDNPEIRQKRTRTVTTREKFVFDKFTENQDGSDAVALTKTVNSLMTLYYQYKSGGTETSYDSGWSPWENIT